jgi:hypothetical protein
MMDSDPKPVGRTEEEELPSVLGIIKEKLRPLLLRKWRHSRASLVAEAMEAGLDDEQLELVLRGFRRGYWTGAVDVSSVKSTDLRSDRPQTKSKIH